MVDAPIESRRRAPILGLVVGVWLLLAVLELGLLAVVPGTSLRDSALPSLARATLVALDLLTLAGATLVFGLPLLALARLRGARLQVPLLMVLAWIVLAAYLASWSAFVGVGQFLDTLSVQMWAASPLQMVQHAAQLQPYGLVLLPIVSLGAVLLMGVLLPPALARAPRAAIALAWGGLAFLLACLTLAWLGDRSYRASRRIVNDPDLAVVYALSDRYRVSRNERSGPLVHALADFVDLASLPAEKLLANRSIGINRKPITPMDDYLAGVDRETLNRWDVILLLVESLRPDQLETFSAQRAVMPNVDAVAREGWLFTNAYTQASHSSYADLCPLSSHYPLRSMRTHFYPENPSYPRVLIYDVLKALGWRTAIFSSQNETWQNMDNYLETGGLDHFLHSETYDGPTYLMRNDFGFAGWVKGEKRAGKIDDRFTVSEGIEWIGEQGDRPYFIYMNLQSSHVPYEVPADFPRRFGPERPDFYFGMANFPADKIEIIKDLYADSLAYVDHQIGRLVDFLRATGRWERTVLIVTGDTGQAFNEHGFVTHAGPIYNEVMRVPLIFRAPGLQPGSDGRPAQHIDVPPSLFGLLGLPPHPSFQGIDLFRPQRDAERSIFLVAQTPVADQYALVRSGYKLIYDRRQRKVSLYDLSEDPGELEDLAGRRPFLQRALLSRLQTWRKAQVDYYMDRHRHTREYPPVLEE